MFRTRQTAGRSGFYEFAVVVSFLVALIICCAVGGRRWSWSNLRRDLWRVRHLCHQLPDRSYFIDGHKFAVCSRCTGLYAGFALTLLLYPLIRSLRNAASASQVVATCRYSTRVDFSLTFFGFWENTHTSRLLTGALLGAWPCFT